ncbi:MAG TPA: methyltransferase domain-containing protein [Chthoniobacterales bacterium]
MPTLDPTQLAAQEQFSRQSQRYATGHILENVQDVVAALEFIPLAVPSKMLDVACGAGHTGLHLAALGHDVTLADLSQPMLDRALEGAVRKGVTVRTVQHPAEAMPYADDTFDLATCRIAPHHFSSPASFVREVARVLKPGGRFLLIDGTIPDENPEAGAWLNKLEKLRDPSHARLLPPGEWCQLCKDAGLTVERSTIHLKEQPDIEWYFRTADTSPDNRNAVLEMIDAATPEIVAVYRITTNEGKISWWWPIATVIACK